MDKRLTFPGGEIAITNDELNLMPNSNKAAIDALGAGLGSSANFILSGVNASINGSGCTVVDGFVYLNGEVLKVDAGFTPKDVGVTGDQYEFQKITLPDDPGYQRNYRDGSSHNVAQRQRAVAVNVNSVSSLDVTGPTLTEQLATLLQLQSDWAQSDTAAPDFIKNKPIIQDIRNVGYFGNVDAGGGTQGSNYSVSGNITQATLTQIDGNTNNITVTFANAMDNTNYYLRVFPESRGANIKNDGQIRHIVSKPLSTTTAMISVGEEFGVQQALRLHVEAVQL